MKSIATTFERPSNINVELIDIKTDEEIEREVNVDVFLEISNSKKIVSRLRKYG